MRSTGIPLIGDVPWGTHFCQFYQEKQDLIDILVPYFKAGLESNEFCMWVTSEPLGCEEARAALKKALPALDDYIRKGQIEILDHSQWYTVGGQFDSERVLQGWVDKLQAAEARGFEGLRLTGNTFWLEKSGWADFTAYEETVDGVIGRYRMLAICTYCLAKCGAAEIMDVVSNHAFALVKRAGAWQLIESRGRKSMQAALHDMRERYARTAAVLPGVLYEYAMEPGGGMFLNVSPPCMEILEVEPDAVERDAGVFWNMIHPDDVDRLRTAWTEVNGAGTPLNVEFRVVTPSGKVKWIQADARSNQTRDGDPVVWSGVFLDVSQRKNAEGQVRFLADLIEKAEQPVGVGFPDGRLGICNRAFCELTGYTAEELRSVDWGKALTPPEWIETEKAALEEMARTGKPVRYQKEYLRKDGSRVPIELLVHTVRDRDGKAQYYFAFITDITDRQRAEDELRRQREWLKVTLSSIGDAVIASDVSGKITFLNPVAAELTGWSEAGALGKPVQEVFQIVNERTGKAAEDIVRRVLENGRVISLANETALHSKDGRVIPIEDSAAPILDHAGRAAGVVLVFHDVTDKRRAQEALRRSEERVRRKLESILSPEGDIGVLELGDIIDSAGIQSLIEDFHHFVPIPMAIIDLNGTVLVGVGWQDICTKFHRVHPVTCSHCIESDTRLSAGVAAGEFRLYRCKNNMWDMATPILIGGRHVGNLFTGQFFFKDEPVDSELFRRQAREYGFDEQEYLAALDRVTRLSREDVNAAMTFFVKLGQMLSVQSFSNIKLARSLAERDALTDSLKESGGRLNRAQEIAHLGSWELDLFSGRLSWSDEVYRIFGLQPQEFGATYEAFLAAVHPDDRATVDAAYSASLREGKSSYEIAHRVVRRKTGEVRWVQEKCEHFRDEAGKVVRSVGMVQDITERRLAEDELRRVSDQRRLALEAAELGAWDYRFDTGDVFWDQQCSKMFGMQGQEHITFDAAISCIHPDDRGAVNDALQRALSGVDGGAYHVEFRVVWPDSSVHWVTSHGRVYFEGAASDRRPVRFIGVISDFTERKRAEENLRQAQKLESIGLLAGGIAHDFNNLLVGVIGNASMAEDMLPHGNPAVEILKRIVIAGEQAAHLTRQLLAYAGKGRFILEPVDLSEVVRESGPLIQSSMPGTIKLNFDLAAGMPTLESDPSQMQQVFINLALNASEAIGENPGIISIRTGQLSLDETYIRNELAGWPIEPGQCAFLEVHDTGAGMDAGTLSQIFEPFFTTKFQGRGLGLAATAGIVRAHKGAIHVSSAPGAGSTFRILLPTSISRAPAHPTVEQPKADLMGEGTILVVDDEQVVRDVARMALERRGYEVLLAETGPGAIELVKSSGGRIGLVVLDMGMPGMSGEEALPLLRDIQPDLNVIVASGYSEAEALRRFHGARVSGFIQKPYTAQELARRIKTALS